jgi:hypothetical protein
VCDLKRESVDFVRRMRKEAKREVEFERCKR